MVESPALAFSNLADQLRAEIDTALTHYTEFDDDCPPRLREAIRYCLLAPGKRLRPLLVLMSATACGYERRRALPAAAAVEMIHAYSLIHDDLPAMDDDDLRRGRPSCHAKYGEATAILAGDALLARAFEIVAADVQPAEVAAKCCWELARAAGASALVGGQFDDLSAETLGGGLAELQAIHRRKTGAMFRVCLRLGAVLAAADDEQLTRLDTYGQKLGLAFQIVDDLLDVRGKASETGKRTGKDTDRGKLTFPGVVGVEESGRLAEQLIDDACAALAPFGTQASALEALARYVVERNH